MKAKKILSEMLPRKYYLKKHSLQKEIKMIKSELED